MPRVEVYGVVDVSGTPQPGASVQVNTHGGGAASLFTTEAGAVAASNPLTTGADGVFGASQSVWAAEGTYDFVCSGSGFTTFTVTSDAVRGSNVPGAVLSSTGDIAYASSANTIARLAAGATGALLKIAGGIPAWLAIGNTGDTLAVSGGVPTWSKTIRGSVSSTGTVVSGSGFSASKTATGTYAITFTQSFSAVPIIVICGDGNAINGGAGLAFSSPAPTTGGFTALTYSSGVLANSNFTFVAVEAL
jgi:hypothetical protein